MGIIFWFSADVIRLSRRTREKGPFKFKSTVRYIVQYGTLKKFFLPDGVDKNSVVCGKQNSEYSIVRVW